MYSNVKENASSKPSSLQAYHSTSNVCELLIKRNIYLSAREWFRHSFQRATFNLKIVIDSPNKWKMRNYS